MHKTNIHEIGRSLAFQGLVSFGRRTFNQTRDNCHQIAQYLAYRFGYVVPNKIELTDEIIDYKINELYGRTQLPFTSQASLVIREGDSPGLAHVAFEYRGKEFNFGPSTKQGFTIVAKIPLRKVSINKSL